MVEAARGRRRGGWGGALLLLFAFALLQGVIGQRIENNGGHLRHANLRWVKLEGNTVEITLTTAWKRDYSSAYWQGSGPDGYAITGDVIQLNGKQWPVLAFGDETVTMGEYIKMTVTAYSVEENFVYGTSVLRHTYATPTKGGQPWQVKFTGCCKLSNIANLNQKDVPWHVSSTINLLDGAASPVIPVLPVVTLPDLVYDPENPNVAFVSFYAPGFDPLLETDVSMELANATTALTETQTNISTSIHHTTGQVFLRFDNVTYSESAQAGQFFFLKLTAKGAGGHVQADFLLKIIAGSRVGIPKIAHGHADASNYPFGALEYLNSTGSPGMSSGISPLSPVSAPILFPDDKYVAYAGFPVRYSLSAAVTELGNNVGFGASGLPLHSTLSTVRGTNPVVQDFSWSPCFDQVGRRITCYEAVTAGGNASSPECVDVVIRPDPAPIFLNATDDGASVHRAAEVIVTLGATKRYTVTASDVNCLDAVTLGVSHELPPGAVLADHVQAHNLVNQAYPELSQCHAESAHRSVSRTLEWLPHYTQGGFDTQICFTAQDACGDCNCAGVADTTVNCVTFRVTRCRYSVGATERRLSEIAAKYGTNWLQIWKMNPELSHPDYVLYTGQSVAVGRLLSVGAGDDLQSIALRYGTTVEALYDLNHDLNRTATISEGMMICVIPNSCEGQSQTVTEPTALTRTFVCSSGSANTDGVTYATFTDCVAQCAMTSGVQGTCSTSRTPMIL